MEFIETNKRAVASNGFLLTWAAVAGLLPWLGYVVHDWRQLCLITSLPLFVVPFVI